MRAVPTVRRTGVPDVPAPAPRARQAVRAVAGSVGLGRRSSSRSTRTGAARESSVGATSFPRHWVYDDDGRPGRQVGPDGLSSPGTTRSSAGAHRGERRTTAAFVTAAETALDAGSCRPRSCVAARGPRCCTWTRERSWSSKARRGRTCSCCSTESSRSWSTGDEGRGGRTGGGSRRARRARGAGGGRPRCAPRPGAGWRGSRAAEHRRRGRRSSCRQGHRREER